MNFSLLQLFTLGLGYLFILFGSAYAAERGWLPSRLVNHPATRVLALGVFAGAICFFGTFGMLSQYGSGFFLYFLGASAAFLIAPILLSPLSRTALNQSLGSLADVFAYRYPSRWIGGLIAVLMLVGLLPLIALQINAVSVSLHLLNQALTREVLAILFCLTMIVFAILFGARHLSTRTKHEGLVFALALASIFKAVALVTIAWFCLDLFGGIEGLGLWLDDNRAVLESMSRPLSEGESRSLLLVFFAAAVAMPHVYHILLTENDDEQLLAASRWGFPLYMLLLGACIPLIGWAAIRLGADMPAEYHLLGVGLMTDNTAITILGFMAGVAAASGVLIVSTLALASMTLNHVILPFYRPLPGISFYTFLVNTRRLLIAAIILGAYGFHRMIIEGQQLVTLGMVSFVAVSQFLPGLLAAFYWRRATRAGLIAGLGAGFGVWFLVLFFPLASDLVYSSLLTSSPLLYERHLYEPSHNLWHAAATWSIIVNSAVFVLVSLLTRPTSEEYRAAGECISDSFSRPWQGEIKVTSIAEVQRNLASLIGQTAAEREVALALEELGLRESEARPYALSSLRNRLESNLSTLMGQTIAHDIVERALPYHHDMQSMETVHTIETRVEDQRSRLTGITAELDALRRYHRQILHDLPTAVCSINREGRVLSWNRAMEQLTNIVADDIVGSTLAGLPDEWHDLLHAFAFDDAVDQLRKEVRHDGELLLLNLHKASIDTVPSTAGDVVVVIEDMTDEHRLEQQLQHRERLASIGQLAAGVAHEIGNPVTGIACLAQNLKLDAREPELLELSNQILEQTDRISAILQSLVNFSRADAGSQQRPMVPVNLRQCTDEALKLLSLGKHERQVRYINDCPPELAVPGDPHRLAQVFINVLSNARDASGDGGRIVIEGRLLGEVACVTVTDEGHGIEANHLKKMFDPFFTTKDPGSGTGLGLAIVSSILEEHHGHITADSAGSGLGTRVTVTLPAHLP